MSLGVYLVHKARFLFPLLIEMGVYVEKKNGLELYIFSIQQCRLSSLLNYTDGHDSRKFLATSFCESTCNSYAIHISRPFVQNNAVIYIKILCLYTDAMSVTKEYTIKPVYIFPMAKSLHKKTFVNTSF